MWFRVDDGFAFHQKTVAAGNAALGLWVRAGAYCGQHLTDGFVSGDIAALLGTPAQAQRLVKAGLWMPADGGYQFHDWTQCNPPATQIRTERKRKQVNQQTHRDREAAKDQGNFFQDHRSFLSNTKSGFPESSRSEHSVTGNAPVTLVGSGIGSSSSTEVEPERTSKRLEEELRSSSLLCEPHGSHGTNKTKTDQPGQRDDVERVCQHLADRIEQQTGARPKIGLQWRRAARLLLDADHRTEEQVHTAIDWCQNDEFWRSNVLSMSKLREKYIQLRAAAQRSRTGNGASTATRKAQQAIEAGREYQEMLDRKELE